MCPSSPASLGSINIPSPASCGADPASPMKNPAGFCRPSAMSEESGARREKHFWHTELSENAEEKTKLYISVPMHPALFPSPLRALCVLRPGCVFRRPRRKIVSAGRQPGHAGRVCSPAKEPCGVSFCHFDGFNYHAFALRDDRPTLAHLLTFYCERLRRRTIKGLRFKN